MVTHIDLTQWTFNMMVNYNLYLWLYSGVLLYAGSGYYVNVFIRLLYTCCVI